MSIDAKTDLEYERHLVGKFVDKLDALLEDLTETFPDCANIRSTRQEFCAFVKPIPDFCRRAAEQWHVTLGPYAPSFGESAALDHACDALRIVASRAPALTMEEVSARGLRAVMSDVGYILNRVDIPAKLASPSFDRESRVALVRYLDVLNAYATELAAVTGAAPVAVAADDPYTASRRDPGQTAASDAGAALDDEVAVGELMTAFRNKATRDIPGMNPELAKLFDALPAGLVDQLMTPLEGLVSEMSRCTREGRPPTVDYATIQNMADALQKNMSADDAQALTGIVTPDVVAHVTRAASATIGGTMPPVAR